MLVFICFFIHPCLAQDGKENVIRVPQDYPTIQEGIDNAEKGDTVLVWPGKYPENIDFKGKAIVLKSESGPQKTVINGRKKAPVVVFRSGENNDSVLEGFTVENGFAPGKTRGGGGILCLGSGPLIKNNIIKNNRAENGGGVLCQDSGKKRPLIISNLIEENSAVKGGGIRSSASSALIANNVITGNKASRLGGGIYWRQDGFPSIINNTITGNSAGEYGGGIFGSNHLRQKNVLLANCIIWKNSAPRGAQIALNLSGTRLTIASSDIQQARKGIFLMSDKINLQFLPDNISIDPDLTGDYYLTETSMCVDSGNNKYIGETGFAFDFTGKNRIIDGNGDGKAIVDIGACEFQGPPESENKQ